jgi:hypothetical protein
VASKNLTTLVSAAVLKKAFETGAIPTETDYGDLIRLADIGRQAVGFDEAMKRVESQATGLFWKEGDPLRVRLTKSSTSGEDISGLQITQDGIAVKAGQGLVVGKDGVALVATGALQVSGGGLSLQLGKGLTQDGSSLALKLDSPNSGLELGAGGLAISLLKTKSGLSTVKGLGIAIDDKYLTITDVGLALTGGALEQAVKDIGGALAVAIKLLKNYELKDEKLDFGNTSKAAKKLQDAFLEALHLAASTAEEGSLKGWAASMRAALTGANAIGQSVMVESMLADAARRKALEERIFYPADGANGIFLAVRVLGAAPETPKSSIDAGTCVVVFNDKTAAVAKQLFVGFGGYYLAFSDVNPVQKINDINFILLSGSIDSRSVVFHFRPST